MGMVVAAMTWARVIGSGSEIECESALAMVPAGLWRWVVVVFPCPGPHGAIGDR